MNPLPHHSPALKNNLGSTFLYTPQKLFKISHCQSALFVKKTNNIVSCTYIDSDNLLYVWLVKSSKFLRLWRINPASYSSSSSFRRVYLRNTALNRFSILSGHPSRGKRSCMGHFDSLVTMQLLFFMCNPLFMSQWAAHVCLLFSALLLISWPPRFALCLNLWKNPLVPLGFQGSSVCFLSLKQNPRRSASSGPPPLHPIFNFVMKESCQITYIQ